MPTRNGIEHCLFSLVSFQGFYTLGGKGKIVQQGRGVDSACRRRGLVWGGGLEVALLRRWSLATYLWRLFLDRPNEGFWLTLNGHDVFLFLERLPLKNLGPKFLQLFIHLLNFIKLRWLQPNELIFLSLLFIQKGFRLSSCRQDTLKWHNIWQNWS